MLTTAGLTFCDEVGEGQRRRSIGRVWMVGWCGSLGWLGGGDAHDLPSVSPNALVAIRAAAARITGLRVSFRELSLAA